jgi:23S rRNA pseudouridine1911/1915/1917 synthase
MDEPRITAETPFYIIAEKPHNMHTAPLRIGETGTLLDWCARAYPEVRAVQGRKPVEGGLLHRLDYETAGLVLIARNQAAFDILAAAQKAGCFSKDYRAAARPQPPETLTVWNTPAVSVPLPGVIKTAFRHYGPGRKLVKPEPPAAHSSIVYETCVQEMKERGADVEFYVRLTRGFHHQVRAHLASIGYPINNDMRYGGVNTNGPLELTAWQLTFPDPEDETVICSVCMEQ